MNHERTGLRALKIVLGALLMFGAGCTDIADLINGKSSDGTASGGIPQTEAPDPSSPDESSDTGDSPSEPSDPAPTPSPDDGWQADGPLEEIPAAPGELVFATENLRVIGLGVSTTRVLEVAGGAAPYTFRMDGGELPPGLAFDAVAGKIEGTPTEAGSFRFQLAVKDSADVEVQADVEMSVIRPESSKILANGASRTDLVATHGLQQGLFLTLLRGAYVSAGQELDWSKVDFAAAMAASPVRGSLSETSMGVMALLKSAKIMPRCVRALEDVVCEFDGWIWVETPGVLKLRVTAAGDPGRLYFGGNQVAALVTSGDRSYPDTVTLEDVERGFHRIRFEAFSTGGGLHFQVERAVGADGQFSVIPDDVLYHGPEIHSTPLLIETAVVGREFRSRLNVAGGTPGRLFEIVAGGLPAGLTLDATGLISGTSQESGTHYFTVRLTNSTGISTTRYLGLHVLPPMPAQNMNTAEEFCLTFEESLDLAPGIDYSQPASKTYGDQRIGPGTISLMPFLALPGDREVYVDHETGTLGSSRSLAMKTRDVGFHFLGDQQEHLSDYFPAVRTANRFGVCFKMPSSLTHAEFGELRLPQDARAYLNAVLYTAQMAGHNTMRYANHVKEQGNWHFYHRRSPYWPDAMKCANLRYLGDGWFYIETSEQHEAQRGGFGDQAGFYNPIEDYGIGYFESLSRLYFGVDEGYGKTSNTYADPTFHYDNVRLWSVENTMTMETREGDPVYRRVVGSTAGELHLPFRATYSGQTAARFRIARYGGNVPNFEGSGVFIDANGNGLADEGETELRYQPLTPVFTPGEIKNFVYVVDVSKAAIDRTVLHGVTFRARDPHDVYSLCGDSMKFLIYKSNNPGAVKDANVFVGSSPSMVPSPTAPANQAPTLAITSVPAEAKVGVAFRVTGTATDADGPHQPRPYWDFGDGSSYAFGTEASHVYTRPGIYTIRFYGADSVARTSKEIQIEVKP